MGYFEHYGPRTNNGHVHIINLDESVSDALNWEATLHWAHISTGKKIRQKLRRTLRATEKRPKDIGAFAAQGTANNISKLAACSFPRQTGEFSYEPLDWYSAGVKPVDQNLPDKGGAETIRQQLNRTMIDRIRDEQDYISRWDSLEDTLEQSHSQFAL